MFPRIYGCSRRWRHCLYPVGGGPIWRKPAHDGRNWEQTRTTIIVPDLKERRIPRKRSRNTEVDGKALFHKRNFYLSAVFLCTIQRTKKQVLYGSRTTVLQRRVTGLFLSKALKHRLNGGSG